MSYQPRRSRLLFRSQSQKLRRETAADIAVKWYCVPEPVKCRKQDKAVIRRLSPRLSLLD